MAEPATGILSLESVGQTYGARTVLNNVNLSLKPGRVILVAGGNGAGKSTLLKIMAGAIAPTKGWVHRTIPQDRLAYMGHKTFLYAGLTAMENVMFWAELYNRPANPESATEVLRSVGLGKVRFERVGHFSRGMAQRLSLARVLLLDPDLWLLDEPGTGLDAVSKKFLVHEIGQARGRGRTLVWVSHDLDRDGSFADEVIVVKHGRADYAASIAAAMDEVSSGC